MRYWRRFHSWAWWARWPLKLAAFLVVAAVVLYPKLWLLPTWVARLRDMDSTLEPDHPGLVEFEEAARAGGGAEASAEEMLPVVEEVVCRRIPYAWDWDVWGVMDYLPTTSEVLQQGREDCDGRAVVAAALLRRMGYEARLVSDLKHVWVATPRGEIMGPGEGEKTLEADETGTRVRLSQGLVANVGRGLSFGVAVFPLTRELIILGALCGLTMHPRSSVGRRVLGCLLLLLGLGLVHDSHATAYGLAREPSLMWAGWASAGVGWLLLAVKVGGRRLPRGRPG